MTSRVKTGLLLAGILVLVSADGYVSCAHSRYVRLLSSCERDPFTLQIGEGDSKVTTRDDLANRSLVFLKQDSEVLRIPFHLVDNAYRTHVGEMNGQICVFDGTVRPKVYDTYTWRGERYERSTPDSDAWSLLRAMAAADEGGTSDQWTIYFLLRPVILIAAIVMLVRMLSRTWGGPSATGVTPEMLKG